MKRLLLFALFLTVLFLASCEDVDWYKIICENPEGWKQKAFCLIYEPDEKSSNQGPAQDDSRCKDLKNSHFDPSKNACACNSGFVEQYFTATGTLCVDARQAGICEQTLHTHIDPSDGYCKCDDGYKAGTVYQTPDGSYQSRECIPIAKTTAPAGCRAESADLQRVEGEIAAAKAEMAEGDKIAQRIERLSYIPFIGEDPDRLRRVEGYDPSLPPFPQIPFNNGYKDLLFRYKNEASNLQWGISQGVEAKISGARDFFDKGQCAAGKALALEAEQVIGGSYWGFQAARCALLAKPRVQKDALTIVSTSLELPPGCNCQDLRFTIVNREFNNAAVLGMMISSKRLKTLPACKAVSGELINVPDLPNKIVINQYYGKRGLFWIYYETSWIYGHVEPA